MNDRKSRRLLIQAASSILEHLALLPKSRPGSVLPESHWECLRKSVLRRRTAIQRGWQLTVQRLQEEVEGVAADLIERLQREYGQPESPIQQQPQPSTLHDIYSDLAALYDEFEEVEIDLKQRRLSVTTEPIVLEGVHLGPFQIVFRWDRIGGPTPYHVIAVDPCPASDGSSTVHPHVSYEALCEGEGQGPIQKALKHGRLLDFFTLVRQILTTYNPRSAYVTLDRWNGVECRDCGMVASPDESTSCDRCHIDICLDCSSRCGECEELCCGGCRRSCFACGQDFCTECLSPCSECGEEFCSECLDNERCGSCRREESNLDLDEQIPEVAPAATESASPCPAFLALCVGETPVLA